MTIVNSIEAALGQLKIKNQPRLESGLVFSKLAA